MGMKGIDDLFEDNSSNKESIEDNDDNLKVGGILIESFGKDVIEFEISGSLNNDDIFIESGEDFMINMILNIENKLSNDKL